MTLEQKLQQYVGCGSSIADFIDLFVGCCQRPSVRGWATANAVSGSRDEAAARLVAECFATVAAVESNGCTVHGGCEVSSAVSGEVIGAAKRAVEWFVEGSGEAALRGVHTEERNCRVVSKDQDNFDCDDARRLCGVRLAGTGRVAGFCGRGRGDVCGDYIVGDDGGSLGGGKPSSESSSSSGDGGTLTVEKEKEEKEKKKKKKLGSRARRRLRDGYGGVPEWRRGAGAPQEGDVKFGKKGFFAELPADGRKELRESRAAMLTAQNKLRAVEARQRLQVVEARDVAALVKRQETRLLRDTECNKVQIEKAFGTLAATGNVPGVGGSVAGGGKVEGTVATGVSPVVGRSISPNSSASMKEFHELQKECLSLFKDKMDLESRLERLKLMEPEAYKRIGGDYRRPETVDTGYTVDTDGNPTGLLPEGHCGGEVKADGRFHFHPDIMDDYDRW